MIGKYDMITSYIEPETGKVTNVVSWKHSIGSIATMYEGTNFGISSFFLIPQEKFHEDIRKNLKENGIEYSLEESTIF